MRDVIYSVLSRIKYNDFSKIKCVNDCLNNGLSGFVFGRKNLRIKREVRRICENKEQPVPIIILGESGTGKTHLSYCIEQEVQKTGNKCIRETTESCIDRLVITIKDNKTLDSFLEYYHAADVIIIDEIEDMGDKTSTQKMLLECMEKLTAKRKHLILMGLPKRKELSSLLNRKHIVCNLHSMTQAQKKYFVKRILHASGIKLSKETVILITQQNMGAIVGGLNRLIRATIDERKMGYIYLDSEKVKYILGTGFYKDSNEPKKT